MSLGVNLLMYLTEVASKSLNDDYLSKVFEVHHKYKKDYQIKSSWKNILLPSILWKWNSKNC